MSCKYNPHRMTKKAKAARSLSPSLIPALERAVKIARERHSAENNYEALKQMRFQFDQALMEYERGNKDVSALMVYLAGLDEMVLLARIIEEGCGAFPRYNSYRRLADGGLFT